MILSVLIKAIILSHLSFALISPPVAEKINKELKLSGDVRIDPYYWIRDVKNPKVTELLNAENKYFNSYFTKADLNLKKTLVKEMRSKIEEDSTSAEVVYGNYSYYTKSIKGKNYRQHLRREITTGKIDLLLDENEKAKGHTYLSAMRIISPDLTQIAWAFDYNGSAKFQIELQDLKTLKMTTTPIVDVYWGSYEWSPDSQSLFYTIGNSAWRPDTIWQYYKGVAKKVLTESDELFNLALLLSTDSKYLFATSGSFQQSKIYYWTGSEFKELISSQKNVLLNVDHSEEGFFVHSNHKNKNFGIYQFDQIGTSASKWKEVVAPNAHAKISNAAAIQSNLIYSLRSQGNDEFHAFNMKTKQDQKIPFADPFYMARLSVDGSPKQAFINYSSPLTPLQVLQVNLADSSTKLVKQSKSPSLNASLYKMDLRTVKSRDGKDIPIHVVYRKDKQLGKPQPTLLYGYGSYGLTIASGFRETLFSLLDRGFVYVNAHVRGSDAQGEDWYDDGKMMNKKNTFNDFVDVADQLIREKTTTPALLAIRGGSAGGLLIGATINQKPENFKAAIAEVAFVDMLTTMSDPTIPLTTQEYLQWGNPNEKAAYDYMKSYSPYDNIKEKTTYPAVLAQTGINDQQVSYWEPTKWVQKLRDKTQSKNPILININMGAGHGGASGRYARYEEEASKYIFLIKELK